MNGLVSPSGNLLTVTDFGGLDVGIPQAMRRSIDLGVTTGLASPSFPYFAVEPLVFLRHVEVPEGIPLAIEVGGS